MSTRKHEREAPGEPVVSGPVLAPIESLLVDEEQAALLLGIRPTSVCNLESRDSRFPRPVQWALDSKRWRRADIVAYVEQLKQRGA